MNPTLTNHQRSIDSYCLGILIGDVSYSMKAFAESLRANASGIGLSQAEPVSRLGPSGFDPFRNQEKKP